MLFMWIFEKVTEGEKNTSKTPEKSLIIKLQKLAQGTQSQV